MKKVFLMLMMGKPFDWTQQFIDHVQHLEQDGWYFEIFTPNDIASKGNVEIVPMNAEQFCALVEQKLGVKPEIHITEAGIPSLHVTDYIVAHGAIFEDYIVGYDFWGHIGMDNVIGKLSTFISDSELQQYDIWTDDINAINGNFCLFRNIPQINNLFKVISHWQEKLTLPSCPGCIRTGQHQLAGTDEYDMTELMRLPAVRQRVRYGYPPRFFIHSHDRLVQHFPTANLQLEADGALMEIFEDIKPPNWPHFHNAAGREIAYYHFQRTKKWPL